MRKLTVAQMAVFFACGAAAGVIGYQLSGQRIGVAYVASILVATLSFCLAIAKQAGRATTFTCPVKGCGVYIRAAGASDAELARLRALATDHSKHTR